MIVADVLRALSASSCLALVVVTMYALTLSSSRDQQHRMLTLAGFAAVISGSNLAAWGDPFRWQLAAFAVLGLWALVATLIFVRRERRIRNDAA